MLCVIASHRTPLPQLPRRLQVRGPPPVARPPALDPRASGPAPNVSALRRSRVAGSDAAIRRCASDAPHLPVSPELQAESALPQQIRECDFWSNLTLIVPQAIRDRVAIPKTTGSHPWPAAQGARWSSQLSFAWWHRCVTPHRSWHRLDPAVGPRVGPYDGTAAHIYALSSLFGFAALHGSTGDGLVRPAASPHGPQKDPFGPTYVAGNSMQRSPHP